MNKMIQSLGWCLARQYRFRICIVTILVIRLGIPLHAQSIDTQPLTATSICAGSQLDVTGHKVGVAGDLAVELSSDGVTFSAIPSVPLSTSGSTDVVYRATIPGNASAGSNYRIRLVANDPTIASMPSPTLLTVKAKPARPTVDSLIVDCMRVIPSGDLSTYVSTTVMAGATLNHYAYYNNALMKATDYYNRYNRGSVDNVIFEVRKTYYTMEAFKYPVEEGIFYCTQTVDGCESDTTKTKLRILYRPFQGPKPANGKGYYTISNWPDIYFGAIGYCIGDKAVPLAMNGHAAPQDNYQVRYVLKNSSQQTPSPPLPITSVPSSQVYELWLDPIDPAKGCRSWTSSQLTVNVTLPPSATLTGNKTLLEWEANPASLSITLSGKAPYIPWTFVYQDSSATGLGSPVSLTTNSSPVVFDVKPRITTSYKIKSVDNGCRNDTLKTSALITVTPLLAVEDPVLVDAIEVYPVPATALLTVHIKGLVMSQTASLQLIDLTGHIVSQQEIQQDSTTVPLDKHSAGIYWLHVQLGDRKVVKRIVKL